MNTAVGDRLYEDHLVAFLGKRIVLGLLVSLIVLSGCSRHKKAPHMMASTEQTIKVDAEHLQMGPPEAKPLTYEISQGQGFVLDMAGYKIDWPDYQKNSQGHGIDLSNATRTIEVAYGPNQGTSLPFDDREQKYTISPDGGLHSGQQVTIGIGYMTNKDSKKDFYPIWVGMVDVK